MASIGEVDPTTPIAAPPDPALEPEIIHPAVQPPQQVVIAPESQARERVMGILRRVWMARGFFGGLVAMVLAFNAQRTLIEQGDWVTAQRYYLIAFVILILSLMHPTFEFFRRESKRVEDKTGDTVASSATVVDVPPANGVEALTPLAPRARRAYGTSIDGNGHSNGNGAGDLATQKQLTGLEVMAPLPTRRAGSKTVLASPAPSIAETTVIAKPQAAAEVAAPVRHKTRPLDLSELPETAHLAEIPRFLVKVKAFYLELRADLGWKVTLPLFLISLALVVSAYLMLHDNLANALAGWVWFASMSLIIVTFYGAPKWLSNLKGLLDGPDDGFFAGGVPQIPMRLEIFLALVLMVGALVIRLYNLDYLPGIFGDEGERGIDARGIMNGNTDVIWGAGWWVVPNVYFYALSWTLRMFGDNMIGDRMLNVISGMLIIYFIYRIGRLLWGVRAGLLAGALLAVSPIWIQFSRHASESTPTIVGWALGFLFLYRALRFRYWVDWALAGMAFGSSLYFYAAGKLVVPLLAAAGAYMLVRWRWEFVKRYLAGYVLMLGTFFLTFMPHFIYLQAGNFTAMFQRANETSIFSPGLAAMIFGNHGVPYDPSLANLSLVDNLLKAPGAWALVIYNQARISFDSLYRVGDTTFFYPIRDHNGSLLTPLLASLCLLGVVYFTWKLWDARYGLAVIWFWIGLAAVIFTIDTPHVQRIVGAWPVLFLFPAVMIDRVAASAWPLNIKFARRWLAIPLVGLVIFASVEGLREYFVIYEAQCSICGSTVQARFVATMGQDYKGYQFGVGGYPVYFNYGSTRFTSPDVEGEDMNVPMDHFPVTDNNGKGLAFILYPANLQYLPILHMMYPDGVQKDGKGNDGSFWFTAYEVSQAQVNDIQVSFASYTDARGNTVHRNEPNLGTSRQPGATIWSAPPQLSSPMNASWEGGLVAPDYGQYTFFLSGDTDATFEIDGETLLRSNSQATVVLAGGPHTVKLSGTLADQSARVDLRWAGGGGAPMPIGSNFLYNGVLGGLTASIGFDSSAQIDAPDPLASQIPYKYEIHPFLSVRDAGAQSTSFGGRPSFVRWQGTLYAPTDGQYSFSIASNGAYAMMLDGQMVLDSQAAGSVQNPITLTEGEHTVDVRYAWQGQSGGVFEWFWAPPGGQQAIVPPSVLTPLKRMWQPNEVTAPTSVPNLAPPAPPAVGIKADALLGADADLKEARGLGADAEGNVYISDNGNHRILVLDSVGRTVRVLGSETDASAEGKFNVLSDIYTSPDGHLYTLDTKNGDVHVFNPDGTVQHYFQGLTPSSLGITAGIDGKIYIANTVGSAVLVFSPDGVLLNRFVGGPDGTLQHFEQPIDVAVAPDGTIYTVDMRNRVAQLDGNGFVVREWPVQWGGALGGSHLVYRENKVVMTDSDRNRLTIIDPTTNQISFVGKDGGSDSQMHIPVGIAVGPNDKVYVMDSGNNRVLVFNDLEP